MHGIIRNPKSSYDCQFTPSCFVVLRIFFFPFVRQGEGEGLSRLSCRCPLVLRGHIFHVPRRHWTCIADFPLPVPPTFSEVPAPATALTSSKIWRENRNLLIIAYLPIVVYTPLSMTPFSSCTHVLHQKPGLNIDLPPVDDAFQRFLTPPSLVDDSLAWSTTRGVGTFFQYFLDLTSEN